MLERGLILSYHQMCELEGRGLQHGMNYRTSKAHSILLMSQRAGAPYPDSMSEDGKTLFYIGHDAYGEPNKGQIDQPLRTRDGALTQNGRFYEAAQRVKQGARELVRVYEKIATGIWVFNGLFELLDAEKRFDGTRNLWVFTLRLIEKATYEPEEDAQVTSSPGRLIPSEVKLAVYRRDKGRCVKCGSRDNLHFDHILPWSKGGSSTNPDNIQLLCQRHNLEKSDRIE